MAATHRQDWSAIALPSLPVGRRRREARRRRKLHEVEVFLDEQRSNQDEGHSTLVRALEGYRHTLRAP